MRGWAFSPGELVLVASLPDVNEELRGEIVEIVAMPRHMEMPSGPRMAYEIEHRGQHYCATEAALRKLPPPGTRPCDVTYDGLTKVTWESMAEIWGKPLCLAL